MAAENQLPLFEPPLNDVAPVAIPKDWRTDGSISLDNEEMDEEQYCAAVLAEIVSCYQNLKGLLGEVSGRIWIDGRNGLPAKMMDSPDEDAIHAREKAIEAISNWSFEEGQAPNETPFYPGAVSATADTLDAIRKLNDEKNRFKDLVGQLRGALEPQTTLRGEMAKLIQLVMKASPRIMRSREVGSLLRDILHPRLSVRQLQRTIPIVEVFPISIRWRWMNGPASKQVKRKELLSLLERKGDQGYSQMDMARILTVPDELFVIRRNVVKDLRVHVRLNAGSAAEKSRFVDYKTRMPVFYLEADQGHWRQEPELVKIPDNAPVFERRKRVDPEPFLQSMPVHRYL